MNSADIISIIAIVISVMTFLFGYLFAVSSERTKRKPILVFEFHVELGWHINNVGNGPALNVIVACRSLSGEWKHFVRIPALAIGSKFHMTWLGMRNAWCLGAIYTDFQNRDYTTISKDDKNYIHKGSEIEIFEESKVGRYWSKMPEMAPDPTIIYAPNQG